MVYRPKKDERSVEEFYLALPPEEMPEDSLDDPNADLYTRWDHVLPELDRKKSERHSDGFIRYIGRRLDDEK